MGEVRSLGMQGGLHTAGMYPRRLREVLKQVDWIGFDVKAPLDLPHIYDRVTGVRDSALPVRESVQAVLASGVQHEFRTTAHPALLDDEALVRIGSGLAAAGATTYALQIYRDDGRNASSFEPVVPGYPRVGTLQCLANLFAKFTLRRDS
jgi:pyruvate formate lyase activating enzyme